MVWPKDLPEVSKDTCLFQPGFVGSSNVELGWILGEVLWWWRLSANVTMIASQIHGVATAMQAPLQEICLCVYWEALVVFMVWRDLLLWLLSLWIYQSVLHLEARALLMSGKNILWPRETFNPHALSCYYIFSSWYKSLSCSIMRCKWQALWVGIRNAVFVIYKLMALFW